MKTITLRQIKALDPCYDPESIGFTEDLELTPLGFIEQFKDKVGDKEDIIWLLCRKQYMSDKDIRLFAVWCAREALKFIKEPDQRSIEACNVAEKFAKGEATIEELSAAESAARSAAESAAWFAARSAAESAAESAAWSAAESAAWSAQIEHLKTYFK